MQGIFGLHLLQTDAGGDRKRLNRRKSEFGCDVAPRAVEIQASRGTCSGQSAPRGIAPLLAEIFESDAETKLVAEELRILIARHNPGEPFGQIVAVVDRAESKGF